MSRCALLLLALGCAVLAGSQHPSCSCRGLFSPRAVPVAGVSRGAAPALLVSCLGSAPLAGGVQAPVFGTVLCICWVAGLPQPELYGACVLMPWKFRCVVVWGWCCIDLHKNVLSVSWHFCSVQKQSYLFFQVEEQELMEPVSAPQASFASALSGFLLE